VYATFVENEPGLQRLQESFMDVVTLDIFWGCVGAIDGWQCFIDVPSVADVQGNVIQYFNGHYQHYGINVQAMCNGQCRFTFVSVPALGGQNSIQAYKKWSVGREFVDKLPPGTFVVADNVYLLLPQMLVPFKGSEMGGDVAKHVYNFFLSQMQL
jgi:DDE superfamily endonuclease